MDGKTRQAGASLARGILVDSFVLVILLLILDDKYEKVHLTYTGNVPVSAK